MQPVEIQNFVKIERAVNLEIERLADESRSKTQHLTDALDRLYLVILHNCPQMDLTHKRITAKKIKPHDLATLNLVTIQEMLDARISEKQTSNTAQDHSFGYHGSTDAYTTQISLREALNIATYNPLNPWGGTWGPLWGKTTALKNVEERLNASTP